MDDQLLLSLFLVSFSSSFSFVSWQGIIGHDGHKFTILINSFFSPSNLPALPFPSCFLHDNRHKNGNKQE